MTFVRPRSIMTARGRVSVPAGDLAFTVCGESLLLLQAFMATIAALSSRLAEPWPRMLESMWRRFMGEVLSVAGRAERRNAATGTMMDRCGHGIKLI